MSLDNYNQLPIPCNSIPWLRCNSRSPSSHPIGIWNSIQTLLLLSLTLSLSHTNTHMGRISLKKTSYDSLNPLTLRPVGSSNPHGALGQQGSRGEVRLIYSFSQISCADGRQICYHYENPIGGERPASLILSERQGLISLRRCSAPPPLRWRNKKLICDSAADLREEKVLRGKKFFFFFLRGGYEGCQSFRSSVWNVSRRSKYEML